MSEDTFQVVVAGDVCVDWLSIPIPPAVAGSGHSQNWQLRGGRSMYARRGGAWLTADFLEGAVPDGVKVHKPGGSYKPKDLDRLREKSPEQIIHSILTLDEYEREQKEGGKPVRVWGVREFEGFAGPADGKLGNQPAPAPNRPDAAVVVLDDAGNGFRDTKGLWPKELAENKKPIVLYKARRPLLKGELWEQLKASHLEQTIAMLSADELRGDGALISRHLSWERTAADVLLTLFHDETYRPFTSCKHLIVTMGLEGALHVSRGSDAPHRAHLWYVPDLIEDDLLHDRRRGSMTGLSSAFAAALAAEIARQRGVGDPAVRAGITQGMRAARYLLEWAYGPSSEPSGKKPPRLLPPAYPNWEDLFAQKPLPKFVIHEVDLPPIPASANIRSTNALRNWRILDAGRTEPIRDLAERLARRGLKDALPEIPVARFNDLETIDRWEIESYRSIRNLFREYMKTSRPERPLCIAVFGRPGAGKSFGVTEVAKSVAEKDPIEKFDFNLSQWQSADQLAVALHRVRDSGLRGRVPLVFFDEFDSSFGDTPLGWLKYFLAPMNDGVFTDGPFTHLIGPAILVFAGGTCPTFQSFREKTVAAEPDLKAPDFLSRLRGNVDVFGPDPLADTRMLLRAMILRRALKKKSEKLFDGGGTLRIHDGILAAFLNVSEFRHGARSIEAIVEMSQLRDREQFEPSHLPPLLQMRLHVDHDEFTRILQRWPRFKTDLERVAEKIHKDFADREASTGATEAERMAIRARPGRQDWQYLDQIYRESNRDQAMHILAKLAAIGCDIMPIQEGDPPDYVSFTKEETLTLARMEHARWMAERSQKQPDHPDLKPWEQLSQPSRDKDLRHVKDLPRILRSAGLKIVRLR